MKIIVAESAGVCWGVERALEMAESALSSAKGHNVHSLGPLIHNPQVVSEFENAGLRVIENIDQIQEGTVVVRSHGIPLQVMEQAKKNVLNVVDATCPFVIIPQKLARKMSREGYFILLIGDPNHPEIKGIRSYVADGRVGVIQGPQDVTVYPQDLRVCILAQTTLPEKVLTQVIAAASAHFGEVKHFNTICDATKVHQEEAVLLAQKVDCMIIIGGKNSSNTKKLAKLCAEIQPATYHIETERELRHGWFQQCAVVGITAGASTPKNRVQEIATRIKGLVQAA